MISLFNVFNVLENVFSSKFKTGSRFQTRWHSKRQKIECFGSCPENITRT